MNKSIVRDLLLWALPTVMLLIALLPIALPAFFGMLLQIVVSIAAAVIAYLLFTQKPKYYIIWGIVFIFFVLIFNPVIKLAVLTNMAIPLALIAAAIFIANWWFVFRKT
jgi:hypothetical protein